MESKITIYEFFSLFVSELKLFIPVTFFLGFSLLCMFLIKKKTQEKEDAMKLQNGYEKSHKIMLSSLDIWGWNTGLLTSIISLMILVIFPRQWVDTPLI